MDILLFDISSPWYRITKGFFSKPYIAALPPELRDIVYLSLDFPIQKSWSSYLKKRRNKKNGEKITFC